MAYVTKNGRALGAGRVTRKSLQIKRGTDSRPLPIHLQCHPKALYRTTLNPYCYSSAPWIGRGIVLADKHTAEDMMLMLLFLPVEEGMYALYVQGDWFHTFSDLHKALEYQVALRRHGIECEIIIREE